DRSIGRVRPVALDDGLGLGSHRSTGVLVTREPGASLGPRRTHSQRRWVVARILLGRRRNLAEAHVITSAAATPKRDCDPSASLRRASRRLVESTLARRPEPRAA